MIPRYFTTFIPPDVRSRGDGYVTGRRVTIARANASTITALVNGTTGYVVTLLASAGRFELTCTCPYAADNGYCKHQWASLREADADGLLAPLVAAAGREPQVVAEPEDFGDLDAEFDAELDERIAAPIPEWKRHLETARHQIAYAASVAPNPVSTVWPENKRIVYIIDIAASWQAQGLAVELALETLQRDGTWAPPVQFKLGADVWFAAPDPADRRIAQMLVGAAPPSPYGLPVRMAGFVLPVSAFDTTLAAMCETGRCRMRLAQGERPLDAVRWDAGPPWRMHLRVDRTGGDGYALTGVLRRADEEMPFAEPQMLHSTGVLLARGTLARFDHGAAFPIALLLRQHANGLTFATAELPELLATLYTMPRLPMLELPAEAGVIVSTAAPVPCLSISPATYTWRSTNAVLTLEFRYGRVRIAADAPDATVFDRTALTLHHRDRSSESAAVVRLAAAGAKQEMDYARREMRPVVASSKLLALVVDLVGAGWHVDVAGALYRSAGERRAQVRSGIDWFELDAGVRFGDEEVALPQLLAAMARGDATVPLRDGSIGLVPTDWVARLKPLLGAGTGAPSSAGTTRFARSQVALLDALLVALPEATADATFETARAELRRFERVSPADPPRTFTGTLREYQREGLGWLMFLRQFSLGGCLADDMGLGKTVQVLALLDALRKSKPGPSIVVVPRSLVFNWMREAERFTPKLRVLDYSGLARGDLASSVSAVDVVLTTYGTLRQDAPEIAAIEFEYAILDEAQAIKNAATASAKAARLIRARHRLAISGTPIENRLTELWSLFEFLNPGMLGTSSAFGAIARLTDHTNGNGSANGSNGDSAGRDLLARALKPVILRRTKDQVAPELPPRVEQTLEVELEPPQRKFYDALLAVSRQSVLERIDRVGLAKARMHVLEALLRLRQAACHPVLADPKKTALPSAKLDALLPALVEVVAEGHKAVVFSQFTSFLALARERLDKAGIAYEYLDGQVRDRESRVDRFQSDAGAPVFLVSLKAGGQGLNLTAADYVYLLDPWWNPAVEAQAIDRAHRIGQTRRVIATRLVARRTIEEKILTLQASKRALADAILTADQGVLARIGRAELEALLASE